jgi:hypothetical protein
VTDALARAALRRLAEGSGTRHPIRRASGHQDETATGVAEHEEWVAGHAGRCVGARIELPVRCDPPNHYPEPHNYVIEPHTRKVQLTARRRGLTRAHRRCVDALTPGTFALEMHPMRWRVSP